MTNRIFYRRQRGSNILYILGLWFFGFFVVVSLAATILIFVEYGVLEALVGLLLAAFYMAFFIYLKVIVGKRRKKLYHNFRQLSTAEQAEVNGELIIKFTQLLWGANRFYYRKPLFIPFVNYDDIAWIYPYSAANIPLAFSVMASGMSVLSSDATGLMIWESDGKRHKIPLGTDAELVYEAIEFIAERVPNVIIGQSKERLELAKTDFNRFLLEEGNID